jgi:hypothetical protein
MMGTDGRGDVVVVHGHRTVPVRVTSGRPRQKAAKKRNTGEKKRSRGRMHAAPSGGLYTNWSLKTLDRRLSMEGEIRVKAPMNMGGISHGFVR